MKSLTMCPISYYYVQKFLDYETFFLLHRDFLPIGTSIGMLHCLSFSGMEDHRFADVRAKFLVSTREKASKFERTCLFSNLNYGIDHLIQKIIFVLPCLFKKAQI